MGGVFFYTAAISFALGIFLRSLTPLSVEAVLLLLLLSFVLAVIWRRWGKPYRSPIFLLSLVLAALALGLLRVEVTTWHTPELSTRVGEEVTLVGTVVRDPDVRAETVALTVREERSGDLVLVSTDRFSPYAYGDRVRVSGEIERPELFTTELGRTFNYPGYLRARGVTLTLPFAEVTVLESGGGNPIVRFLLTGKHRFMEALELVLPEPQAGLGEGLTLGVKRALGPELEKTFRETGIIHIVVLSGYNVMIVAEAIMRLLAFVFRPRTRLMLGVLGISLFALIVGLGATVVRASIMAILVLIARATGRVYAVVRALTIAGIMMLLINPYLLVFDPGFQLSFVATLGLIFVSPLIEARLGLVPTTLQIREFVTATLATQLMVLPLLLYLIGTFSLVAVAVNVLVLPMVPAAMVLVFATGMLSMLSLSLGTLVGFPAHLALSYIIAVPELFARMPFAAMSVPPFPFWVTVLLYGVIVTVLARAGSERSGAHAPEIGDATPDLSDWTIEDAPHGDVSPHYVEGRQKKDALPFR